MGSTRDVDAQQVREWWGAQAWDRAIPVLRLWALQAISPRFGMSEDEREDIAAEVVVRAWSAVEIPDSPSAWIARVTRNLCLDWQKSAYVRRRELSEGEDPDVCESPYPAPDAFAEIEQRRYLAWWALRAIEALPPERKQYFTLLAWHKHPTAEVSQRLGVPVNVMRVGVSRARKTIRAYLQPHMC